MIYLGGKGVQTRNPVELDIQNWIFGRLITRPDILLSGRFMDGFFFNQIFLTPLFVGTQSVHGTPFEGTQKKFHQNDTTRIWVINMGGSDYGKVYKFTQ